MRVSLPSCPRLIMHRCAVLCNGCRGFQWLVARNVLSVPPLRVLPQSQGTTYAKTSGECGYTP